VAAACKDRRIGRPHPAQQSTRKARKGLRRMKSVAFMVKATATDAAGNSDTSTR
jgi:hypothetical protein